jgi:hypothetical protein
MGDDRCCSTKWAAISEAALQACYIDGDDLTNCLIEGMKEAARAAQQ